MRDTSEAIRSISVRWRTHFIWFILDHLDLQLPKCTMTRPMQASMGHMNHALRNPKHPCHCIIWFSPCTIATIRTIRSDLRPGAFAALCPLHVNQHPLKVILFDAVAVIPQYSMLAALAGPVLLPASSFPCESSA
uniref:Uncharacterized protein n=1 Tax=Dunaliella tertiolecta TaxID=3047 RepID=A0A7S3VHE5_DUNTE